MMLDRSSENSECRQQCPSCEIGSQVRNPIRSTSRRALGESPCIRLDSVRGADAPSVRTIRIRDHFVCKVQAGPTSPDVAVQVDHLSYRDPAHKPKPRKEASS